MGPEKTIKSSSRERKLANREKIPQDASLCHSLIYVYVWVCKANTAGTKEIPFYYREKLQEKRGLLRANENGLATWNIPIILYPSIDFERNHGLANYATHPLIFMQNEVICNSDFVGRGGRPPCSHPHTQNSCNPGTKQVKQSLTPTAEIPLHLRKVCGGAGEPGGLRRGQPLQDQGAVRRGSVLSQCRHVWHCSERMCSGHML